MKKAATLWSLTDRQTPWLRWWQEIILNWVASWRTVSTIVVVSANGEDQISWDVPSDLDMQRLELEELLDHDAERRP
jgi:hypothetical protein